MRLKNLTSSLILVIFACVIPSEPPKGALKISLCSSDTISPCSPLVIALSKSLSDSQELNFYFVPSFFDYYSVFSRNRDTVIIYPTTNFSGNTCYSLFSEDPDIESEKMITTFTDTVEFHTYSFEQEPNNNAVSADTLYSEKMFGEISHVNDTDLYFVKCSLGSGYYLKSNESQSLLSIVDSTGKITVNGKFRQLDSIKIPETFIYPLYLRVYSYYRSSGGNYEIGLIKG